MKLQHLLIFQFALSVSILIHFYLDVQSTPNLPTQAKL